MKSCQARAFADNSLKSCDSCNIIGVSAAVAEKCAGDLQMLSSQYIQERLAYKTKSRIDALEQ
jgi:hypothetical protein